MRSLHRIKIIVLCFTALSITAIEAYYFFIRGVPLIDNIIDWLVGIALAALIIEISFRYVGRLHGNLEKEIAERKQAKQELQESEEKYRSLVESIEDSVYLVDRDCKYVFMNRKHLSRFGPLVERVIGRSYDEFHSKKETRIFAKKVHEVFETGRSLSYEYRSDRDGGYFLRTLSPITEQDGRTTAVTVVSKDITERKQAEEVLRESERKFRTLAEQSPNMIFINQKGRIVYANKRCEQVMGYTQDEFCADDFNFLTLIEPEHRELIKQSFSKHMSDQEVEPYEYAVITKDGTRVEVILIAKLIDYRGERAILGTVTDVTQYKRMNEALRQSEEKYRTILESMEEGYFEVDLAGNLTFFNDALCRIFGYPEEELIGLNNRDYTTPQTAKRMYKIFNRVYRTGKPASIADYEVITKDGSKVVLELSTSLMRDTLGDPIGFRGAVRDVTERIRSEQDKRRLEAQLQYARRMEALGTLAGGIAHNFNNLLMGIMGNTSLMLLDTDPAHPNYERLSNIQKSVQSGSRLTGQLLGYAREGTHEIKALDINRLVKETSETFGTTKREIRIHREFAEDLHGVMADQAQIEQVFLNLYVNAADAMPGGGELFLETMNMTDAQMKGKSFKIKPGSYVVAKVRDTGIGMDRKTTERIFEPFFTTKGLAKGTGLGLASVYGMVKAHGGYIDVDSEKGQGTTFSIYLPSSGEKVQEIKASPETIQGGKETLLLVDDEQMVLEVNQEMLEMMGYTVLVAKGGKEAIEFYRENRETISLVILDMIMPDMSGRDTYDKLKTMNPEVKVLLSSGYGINGQAAEFLERGCDGFIQKPFDIKEVSHKVREILDKK